MKARHKAGYDDHDDGVFTPSVTLLRAMTVGAHVTNDGATLSDCEIRREVKDLC